VTKHELEQQLISHFINMRILPQIEEFGALRRIGIALEIGLVTTLVARLVAYGLDKQAIDIIVGNTIHGAEKAMKDVANEQAQTQTQNVRPMPAKSNKPNLSVVKTPPIKPFDEPDEEG
jgi:hypothetical protein